MHTCQIMLVEAETAEQAFNLVAHALGESPDWSDWHEAGFHNVDSQNFAGRWENEIFHNNPEVKVDTAPNFLQYSADPALAELAIERFLQYRLNDISGYKLKAIDLSSVPYDPYSTDRDFGVWYAKKLAQLIGDEWTPDSGLYDLEAYTANLHYFIERVKKSPEKQWLIPVDFHY